MSELNDWAERCYKQGIECWQLESSSQITGLYMTKKKVGSGVPCYGWTSPVYHVWVEDKNVLSCIDYRQAYEIYRRNCDETARNSG